eukprot:CAMPEP_0204382106 /NCGR_PEP_ID=MMETSP0469-20131031/54821_1 /ASSEMBLY_ACC=CAM_ASM_000384 /TAXON_ID=2969 /ORGANISM="Oxyrrhis marina" /LENGTH=50 /DNA_ID=CAMNT_0051374101 /DNA_START=1 /DNA_END=150 /DNA_ORIENTATION=+
MNWINEGAGDVIGFSGLAHLAEHDDEVAPVPISADPRLGHKDTLSAFITP